MTESLNELVLGIFIVKNLLDQVCTYTYICLIYIWTLFFKCFVMNRNIHGIWDKIRDSEKVRSVLSNLPNTLGYNLTLYVKLFVYYVL